MTIAEMLEDFTRAHVFLASTLRALVEPVPMKDGEEKEAVPRMPEGEGRRATRNPPGAGSTEVIGGDEAYYHCPTCGSRVPLGEYR